MCADTCSVCVLRMCSEYRCLEAQAVQCRCLADEHLIRRNRHGINVAHREGRDGIGLQGHGDREAEIGAPIISVCRLRILARARFRAKGARGQQEPQMQASRWRMHASELGAPLEMAGG